LLLKAIKDIIKEENTKNAARKKAGDCSNGVLKNGALGHQLDNFLAGKLPEIQILGKYRL